MELLTISNANKEICHAGLCLKQYLPPIIKTHGRFMKRKDLKELKETLSHRSNPTWLCCPASRLSSVRPREASYHLTRKRGWCYPAPSQLFTPPVRPEYGHFVIGTAIFMVLAMWIFPEAGVKTGDLKRRN